MHTIILDLEWNQPLAKDSRVYRKIGLRMANEIIQIGAVKLDEKCRVVSKFRSAVKPRYYTQLHRSVMKVTKMDPAEIEKAPDFEDAIALFRKWCGEECVFVTWGDNDLPVLKQCLTFYGLPWEWAADWFDLQYMFNRQFELGKEQKSLQAALEYLNIPWDQAFHDALNDAVYTAKIFQRMDFQRGLASYDRSKQKIKDLKFKVVLNGGDYPRKRDALKAAVYCPVCDRMIQEKVKWVPKNKDEYLALIQCERDGTFIERFQFRQKENGKWNLTKMFTTAGKKAREEYQSAHLRQERLSRKRKILTGPSRQRTKKEK